ncbi:hypothetical protein LTSEBAI_0697 [Salmonella enterica subsp. enterica serovar Baildon str. R6-199]|nr:hypothetical protein LTSEBAI_0697 [Salmonella enterica subsp. enterica serovar Baildon str. R6-199]
MMPTDGNDNTRKQDGAVFGQPEVKPIPETLQCTEKWRQVASHDFLPRSNVPRAPGCTCSTIF